MEWLVDPQVWVAVVTLTVLEVVLGIDNVVFIAILVDKLPPPHRRRARLLGLALAMLMRIALLFSLSWMLRLTAPLVTVGQHAVSGRDLILLPGGLFLLAKSTYEIHQKLEGADGHASTRVHASLASVLVQIILLDIVFSLDSVITAVGMTDRLGIMVTAVIIAVVFMMAFSGAISAFVTRHPTVKMLALSFLLLIGTMLMIEGLHQHIPKTMARPMIAAAGADDTSDALRRPLSLALIAAVTRVGALAARRQAQTRTWRVVSVQAKPWIGPWMQSLRPALAPRDIRH